VKTAAFCTAVPCGAPLRAGQVIVCYDNSIKPPTTGCRTQRSHQKRLAGGLNEAPPAGPCQQAKVP